MRHLVVAVGLALAALHAAPAAAQSRVFVSNQGSDSNPCSVTAPCRSFQHAHDVAQPNAEISVLTTGGYGPITISKAISIVNPGGVEAGISVASGQDAITINAGASDTVNLRGLTLDGGGIGGNGVTFHSAANLTIDHCAIRHFVNSGIYDGTTSPSQMYVADTIASDNGSYGIFVLYQSSSSPDTTATATRVDLEGNKVGLGVSGPNLLVGLSQSTVSGNSQFGISASDGFFSLSVDRTTVENNGIGITADSSQYRNFNLSEDNIFANYSSDLDQNGRYFSFGNNNIVHVGSGTTFITYQSH